MEFKNAKKMSLRKIHLIQIVLHLIRPISIGTPSNGLPKNIKLTDPIQIVFYIIVWFMVPPHPPKGRENICVGAYPVGASYKSCLQRIALQPIS